MTERRLAIPRLAIPRLAPALLAAACTAGTLAVSARSLSAQAASQGTAAAPRGKAVYDKWCAGCHGDDGSGNGEAAAYMLPRPRDFTKGVYQIRTTASGELPSDADIRRVIDEGMPGTAMPGWTGRLTEQERDDLVSYLKSFSTFFAGAAPTPVAIGGAPRRSDEGLREGRAAYEKLECYKCHGQAGRGDGPSAPTLTDDWNQPIRAANLAESWHFNGGSSIEEIYTRLRTGLDGTPMPSFSDAVDAGVVSDEQLWRLAQYVRSLSPEQPPEPREVVRARLVEGALPAGPDDARWNEAERFYVPLVGQVVVKPRWFAPSVTGVWVQAMHDGASLAMRLTWHDRSRSPDPAWDEWLGRVAAAVTDADGAAPTAQGPDLVTIQFPTSTAEDAERPFFLGGSTRRPVYAWRWTSTPDQAVEGRATGLGRFTATPGAGALRHTVSFQDGEWRLQLVRPLASADSARAPALTAGTAIPIAFRAADGSNGEDEARGAVSAWYALYLDVPTPRRVYLMPGVSMVLTAGLGLMLVGRAQRRGRTAPNSHREGQ